MSVPRGPAAGVAAVEELRASVVAGAPARPHPGLPGRVTRALAVAEAVGAPSLPALDAALSADRDASEQRRAVEVAAAQARAVATGLLVLPLVLVPGLGRVLDLDLAAFYTAPAGVAVAALSGLLLGVGTVSVAVLVRRVGRPSARRPGAGGIVLVVALGLAAGWTLGLVAAVVLVLRVRRQHGAPPAAGADEAVDLTAIALLGGVSASGALRAAAAAAPTGGDELRRLAVTLDLGTTSVLPAPYDRLQAALTASRRWGAPAAEAVADLARSLRADEHAAVLAAAERLPVLLAFPTALCLLPASILLVAAPLVSLGLEAAAGS